VEQAGGLRLRTGAAALRAGVPVLGVSLGISASGGTGNSLHDARQYYPRYQNDGKREQQFKDGAQHGMGKIGYLLV